MAKKLSEYLSQHKPKTSRLLESYTVGLLEGRDNDIVDLVLDPRYKQAETAESINNLASILESTDNHFKHHTLNEAVVQQDVDVYYNMMMPLVRKTWGESIAHHILGVWPIKSRTQLIYGLVPKFTATPKYEKVDLVIYEVDQEVTEKRDDDLDGEKVIHSEKNKVLLTVTNGKKNIGDTLGAYTVKKIYSNAANFGRILKNFSETDISDNLRPKINEVGLEITATQVTAKTRKLRAEYSIEAMEDLRDQFSVSAEEELVNTMSNIIRLDIDAEIINWVNETATQYEDYDFQTANAVDADLQEANRKRTSYEKAAALALHIALKSNEIGLRTQRSKANILLTTPNVATLLSQLKSWKLGPQYKSDITPMGVDPYFVGEISGIKVVVDPTAEAGNDYCTLIYKGSDRQDAMGWYCPYIPLQLDAAKNSQTGSPVIFYHTSYAIVPIPGVKGPQSLDRAATYASTFSVTNIS